MNNQKLIAIIPARGGSKRIPKKNIIPFLGKPMIAWTIEAAKKSNLFSDVVVSTDDLEIKKVAESYGAIVPFLRGHYADDVSTVSQVTVYTLEKLGADHNTVVQLMPNCPIRNENNIQAMYDFFLKSQSNSVMSCFKFGWMNPWWAFEMDQANSPLYMFPEALKKRSQDLGDLYCPSGAIWMADIASLLKHKTFYMPGHRFFPIEWESAMDIDNYDDLAMALFLANNKFQEID